MDEPHKRLTVTAGTECGTSANSAALLEPKKLKNKLNRPSGRLSYGVQDV
ncbi:predicted protein [Escherichia coli FVEC1302]|nr:predicted protein [Escherichia coli FVEC1302]